MLLNLAKKIPIVRCLTYGCVSLASCLGVVSINTTALTQVTRNSPIPIPHTNITNLIWPTQGYISQGFRKYQHEGIDIAGASGTPIFAAAGGKVVKAGWDDWGLGNAIEIKHPNGSVTVYGHNRRLLVSIGQQVSQGQIIAEMGSTGNSSAPHLHFEYYPHGRVAVNPESFLTSPIVSQVPSPSVAISAAKVSQTIKPKLPSSISLRQKPVSPSLQIPVAFAPVNSDVGCSGSTVLEGETPSVLVKVCQENGGLFYIGEPKQYPSQPFKIPAWSIGKNKYQADNGSFSYVISPEQVEIWRNGSQIRTDSFYTLHR